MSDTEAAEADRFWESIVGQVRRAIGFGIPTPEEAEAEMDGIEADPMTDDEIEGIVQWVIDRDNRPPEADDVPTP